MRKKNATRSALFTSVISLLVCVAMLVGTTFAWFTDEVVSGTNSIVAGNLDIDVMYDSNPNGNFTQSIKDVSDLFVAPTGVTKGLWEPGHTEVAYLKIMNNGTLALKYQFRLDAAAETTGLSEKGDVIKLSEILKFAATAPSANAPAAYTRATAQAAAEASSANLLGYTTDVIELAPGASQYIALVVYMPEDVGNEANYRGSDIPTINFKLTALATQVEAENDSFDDTYDEDAWHPDMVITNAADLAAALANGQDVKLGADVELTEALEVPAGKTVTLNLNGKTLSGNIAKDTGAVLVNNGTLTIVGGEVASATTNGAAAIDNNGTMTLKNVAITGAPIAAGGYPEYAIQTSGTLVVEEGTSVSGDRGAISIDGDGATTINGGIFTANNINLSLTSHVVDLSDDVPGTHTLTINGGTFQHLYEQTSGGVVICNRTKNTVNVNGGNFSGGNYYGNNNLSDYGYGGTFSVKGGTFDAKPAAKYITDGYEAVNNGNGTYSVLCAIDTPAEFADAISNAADGDVIPVAAGNYTIPSAVAGKEITISGAGENTVFDMTTVADVSGAAITFENVKFQGTNANVMNGFGIQGTTEHISYVGCTFDGAVTNEYFGSVSYEDCTFTGTGYITTYAVKSATFTNCVFDKADSRAVLVYSHGDNPCVVELTDCEFYAAAKGYTWVPEWTAAVEVDTTNIPTAGTSVTINNCTYDSNYSGIVRDKSAAGKANAVITVDGTTVQ